MSRLAFLQLFFLFLLKPVAEPPTDARRFDATGIKSCEELRFRLHAAGLSTDSIID